jgi:Flp pilus assembly protein CpaB
MRRRPPRASRVLFVLSLLVATAATLVLRGHLARLAERAQAAGPGRPVLVAASDLDRGTVLDAASVRTEQVPDRYRPPGALGTPEEAAGRALASDVAAGEPLTATRLAPLGGPVASLVPDGLRAVAVTSTVPPGTLVPGDRVDVLATYASGRPHTETVVGGAEVLSLAESGRGEELGGGVTAVLLVSPDTAESLAFARAFADLSLAVAPAGEASLP